MPPTGAPLIGTGTPEPEQKTPPFPTDIVTTGLASTVNSEISLCPIQPFVAINS